MAIPQGHDPTGDVELPVERRHAEPTTVRARVHPYPHQLAGEVALVDIHRVHPQRAGGTTIGVDILMHVDTRKTVGANVFNHHHAAVRRNLGLT